MISHKLRQVITEIERPLAVRPDLVNDGKFYLTGPPDTEILAEGLTYNLAHALLDLLNVDIFNALERIEELEQAFSIQEERHRSDEGYLNRTIDQLQLEVAQLEANPAPIPVPKTAGELTHLHVGSTIIEPIYSRIVALREEGVFVVVSRGVDGPVVLHKDTPIAIEFKKPYKTPQPDEAPQDSVSELTQDEA